MGRAEPYVSGLGLGMNMIVNGIYTVAAERTFWEKVLILHGWQSRFSDKGVSIADKDRAARHYNDVAAILETNAGESALADLDLLERVREHNKLMFRQGWKNYDEARPGSFQIAPKGQLLDDIRADYAKMADMILGDAPPPFDDLLRRIEELEARLNADQ